MVGAEVPSLIVNVQRGGPGLGTIQPSQSDYNQATRGGGNGDYETIVLAPNSVQEMADFVDLGFELAFRYRNPVICFRWCHRTMMEKVELQPQKARLTTEEVARTLSLWGHHRLQRPQAQRHHLRGTALRNHGATQPPPSSQIS